MSVPVRKMLLALVLALTLSQACLAAEVLEPLVLEAGEVRVRVAPVAGGLVWPWDVEVLPHDEAVLATEGPGRLRIIRDEALVPEPVWVSPSPEGDDVLHGVVAHPAFAENRLVYVSYVVAGWRGRTLAIARGRLERDRLVGVEQIFVADAWAGGLHNTAGRMRFGPDGRLYVTVGDRDRLWRTDDDRHRMRAQNLGDHVGTVLRLTDEGAVPADNPFVHRRGVQPEIFAYGFRNGYGLAFHPATAALWMADIGPLGGDEINIVEPGGNYGWPLASMGRSYSGTAAAEQPHGADSGMQQPVIHWTPSVTPSSILFYTGDGFPSWNGSLFVSALSGRQLQRIAFDESGGVERRESLLTELGLRFRDVEQAADGYLYVAAEKAYGTGEPDGVIFRVEGIDRQ